MIWEKAAEGKGRKDSGWMTLAEALFFLFTAAAAVKNNCQPAFGDDLWRNCRHSCCRQWQFQCRSGRRRPPRGQPQRRQQRQQKQPASASRRSATMNRYCSRRFQHTAHTHSQFSVVHFHSLSLPSLPFPSLSSFHFFPNTSSPHLRTSPLQMCRIVVCVCVFVCVEEKRRKRGVSETQA